MNTPFETKFDSMILQAELELDNAKKEVTSHIDRLQFDLERAIRYIKQDEWRVVNSSGIVQQEGSRIDSGIAEVHALRHRLSDLKTMREVALAAIKSAKEGANS